MKSKLKGHQKRVTGLAFSNVLNVLVSSGADAQVNPQFYLEILQDPDFTVGTLGTLSDAFVIGA